MEYRNTRGQESQGVLAAESQFCAAVHHPRPLLHGSRFMVQAKTPSSAFAVYPVHLVYLMAVAGATSSDGLPDPRMAWAAIYTLARPEQST